MKYSWVIVLVAIAMLLFGGWIYLARPDHKYRLTFDVATPQGVVSASNVMAVYLDEFSVGPIGGGIGMKGDAVFLDLGEGRSIVAILAHRKDGSDVDGMSRLAMDAFAAAGRKVAFKEVKRLIGAVPVRGEARPTLIAFTNLSEPKTARLVDPSDVEVALGKGYRLQNVSLEIVPVGMWPLDLGGFLGEPVTRSIEKRLPWWRAPGRPAATALKAAGLRTGSSIDAESAFRRN